MENANIKTVDFESAKNRVLMLDGYCSRIVFIDNDGFIAVEVLCNQNGDVNKSVSQEYDKHSLEDFQDCANAFNGRSIVEYYDQEKDISLQLGYDVANYYEKNYHISIFFDIVDYGFDPADHNLPTSYSLRIPKDDKNYEVIKRVLTFIADEKSKLEGSDNLEQSNENEKESGTSEYKLNYTKYKRTS